MYQHTAKILCFSLFSLLVVQVPPAGEEAAWTAAMALKQKSANLDAAAALAKFAADFPQSTHAAACSVEEGVCWFSAGRSAQVLQRMTPQAQENFDKAMVLFKSVTSNHASALEASRASYMQGSTHMFSGQLELAEADFSAVLDKFAVDPAYVGKAVLQRALVRKCELHSKDAISDLQRWVKDVGAPADLLAKTNTELARAQMLDKPAPRFQPETWFNGDPTTLESQAGGVVALYFFATWCPNCLAELPFVLDVERRFAPLGVHFIGVTNHSKGQTPADIKQYLAEKQISFPVFQDNGAAGSAYQVGTIPMIAVIDRLGNLRWCENPSLLLDSMIEKLLNEGLEPAKKSAGK